MRHGGSFAPFSLNPKLSGPDEEKAKSPGCKQPSEGTVGTGGEWGGGGTDIRSLGYSLADVPPFLGGLGLTPRSQAPGPGRLLSSRRRTAVLGDRGLAPAYLVPFTLALTTLPGGRAERVCNSPPARRQFPHAPHQSQKTPTPRTSLPVSQPNGIGESKKTRWGGEGLGSQAELAAVLPRSSSQAPKVTQGGQAESSLARPQPPCHCHRQTERGFCPQSYLPLPPQFTW